MQQEETTYSDWGKNFSKYIIQFLAIVLAALFVPTNPLSFKEVALIGMIGTIVFAILDIYAPSVCNCTQK